MYDRVHDFIAHYATRGLTGTPCLPAEVAALEGELGVKLPAAYRAYLLHMGRSPDVFVGTDWALRYLRRLQSGARTLLTENGEPFELPPKAFVFLMHQGYQFMYFIADGLNDDPAVYYYLEGHSGPERRAEHFSEWLQANAGEQ
jgi:hypothetical protein